MRLSVLDGSEIQTSDRPAVLATWDGPLARAAVLYTALAAAFLVLVALDPRTVAGEPTWFKPTRFAISIAVYLATVAWLLGRLRYSGWPTWTVRWGVLLCMAVEMALIAGQAARGVPSHFNFSSAFDGAIYGTMGAVIGVNTVLASGLLVLHLLSPGRALDPTRRLASVLGIALFLVGSAVGGMMSAYGGHGVGVPDGAALLPGLGWLREGGDLRTAHFIGLHALQVVPLVGEAVARWSGWTTRHQLNAVALTAVLYAAIFAGTLALALHGRSLLP